MGWWNARVAVGRLSGVGGGTQFVVCGVVVVGSAATGDDHPAAANKSY